jgi:hypothetical protein
VWNEHSPRIESALAENKVRFDDVVRARVGISAAEGDRQMENREVQTNFLDQSDPSAEVSRPQSFHL